MEINKQLFEDVLAGKLKGTFVFRNGATYFSASLYRNYNKFRDTYPYTIGIESYTSKGTYYTNGTTSILDIIDFIPDTNMKENELTIEIPNGKIVDWDESKKQNKIVLKNKQLTYEDVCNKLQGMIDVPLFGVPSEDSNALVATKHQLECILAKNKLANIAVYLNDGWKPGKTNMGHFDAWVLFTTPDKYYIGYVKISNCAYNSNVLFKTKELAQQAIEILGEEIVKLALEPLGI